MPSDRVLKGFYFEEITFVPKWLKGTEKGQAVFAKGNRALTLQGWWLETKLWLLASEWLCSCQEVTLLLRIPRTKEGVLETTAVRQTDLTLSLTQPGQVRSPCAPKSRGWKEKKIYLIGVGSSFNEVRTLQTIWWGSTYYFPSCQFSLEGKKARVDTSFPLSPRPSQINPIFFLVGLDTQN